MLLSMMQEAKVQEALEDGIRQIAVNATTIQLLVNAFVLDRK